jgi:hypothetical protein
MSRYTDSDRAAILRKSRELLERGIDKPAPPREEPPAYEPPPITFEDPLRRWQREADEATRRREAADAERRRQERETERARGADWLTAINACIDRRLAEHYEQFSQLAKASAEFSDAVDARLRQLEELIAKLDATHAKLRAHGTREPLDLPNPLRPRSVN